MCTVHVSFELCLKLYSIASLLFSFSCFFSSVFFFPLFSKFGHCKFYSCQRLRPTKIFSTCSIFVFFFKSDPLSALFINYMLCTITSMHAQLITGKLLFMISLHLQDYATQPTLTGLRNWGFQRRLKLQGPLLSEIMQLFQAHEVLFALRIMLKGN